MGCFQVFEDHEGIEADILRRLAGLGGRPEARSAGQRPALLVVSPQRRPPRSHRSRLPHRPAARGSAPARAGNSRPPAPSAMAQAPGNTLTISSRTVDRLWVALQRELVTVQGQVVERQEFPWPSLSRGLPPRRRWQWPGPSAAGDPPGAARRPLPVKSCPSA